LSDDQNSSDTRALKCNNALRKLLSFMIDVIAGYYGIVRYYMYCRRKVEAKQFFLNIGIKSTKNVFSPFSSSFELI
jgi:hypothetical protein